MDASAMSKPRFIPTLWLTLLVPPAFAATPTPAEPAAEPPAAAAGVAELQQKGAAIREENTGLQRRISELEAKNAELASRRAAQEAELAELLERVAELEAARDD
jgi:hypothetical protein